MRHAKHPGAALWLRSVAIVVLLYAGGATLPAAAADDTPAFYIGVRGVGGISKMDGLKTPGFGGPAQVQHDNDIVGGLGAVFGYAVPSLPVRIELEVVHRFRFDFDVRDLAPGGTIDTEMNVATTSALTSVLAEWRNDSDFTPFVGGTIGWARNSTEVKRVVVSTQALTKRDQDKDNFAWGATLGLDWAFAGNWVAEAAYRYTDLGEVDAGVGPSGDRIMADDYISHDILLTIQYRF